MQLTLQMPDIYFVDYPKEYLAKQIKLFTALMMYRSEQVSAGAACEIAEIDRFTFQEECKKYNIPQIKYSYEEIKDELHQFRTITK